MQCKNGIYLEAQHRTVPCQQCMPCRINKGRKWSARIIMEWLETSEYSYFLTFTVEPEHMPDNGSLEKKYFLRWISDSKKKTGPYRYYAIGEYGDDTHRSHYHMAVFPEHPAQIPAIRALWQKGFTSQGEMSHARARYLANYTAKKLTKADDQRLQPGQEPEFRTSTRNPPFGAAFAERIIEHYKKPKNAELLKERGDVERTFRIDGKIYPMGDWVLKRIRTGLGIPLLESERQDHPGYFDNFPPLEAINEPKEHKLQESYIGDKKRQTKYRSSTSRV